MKDTKLFSTQNNVYGVFAEGTFYPWMNIPSGVIRIVLLKNCNYNCPHCFAEGDANRNLPILEPEFVERVMKFAKDNYGVRTARLTGGEPLLYPHLEELFKRFKKIELPDIDITTNGTFLEEKVPLLEKYGVTNIKVSLNTLDPEKHAKLSGLKKSTLEKVLRGVMAAKEKGFHITLALTGLDNITKKDIYDVMAYARKNDFVFRICEPYYIIGNKETKEKKVFYKVVAELKAKAKKIIHSQCESVDYLTMDDDTKVTIMYNLCDNRLCSVCTKYLYIRLTPERRLKPCLSKSDTEIQLSENPTDDELHLAFMKAGSGLGKGLSKNEKIGLKL